MWRFLNRINDYCLYLLVFSVTFENWNPFNLGGVLSITYVASVLYIASWIPLIKTNLWVFQQLKSYILPLLGFLVVAMVSTALHSNYAQETGDLFNERLNTLIILLIFVASHLIAKKKILENVLWVYVASVLLMFLFSVVGVGAEFTNGRILLFGENPNMIGMKAAVAFLIVISAAVNSKKSKGSKIGFMLIALPLLNLLILTGSRGGLLSVFLGLIFLIFSLKISAFRKMLFLLGGILASVAILLYTFQVNPVFKTRILHTIASGDTGRNYLWLSALKIIENNLLIGVSPPGALPEMMKYSGRYIDPHNVFLFVLMTTGIIGFLFFMTFLFRIGKRLYLAYIKSEVVVYILIFVILLFNMSKAGGGINKIFFWFFFSILIGSTFIVHNNSIPERESEI